MDIELGEVSMTEGSVGGRGEMEGGTHASWEVLADRFEIEGVRYVRLRPCGRSGF
jgi:hypothetical protein